MIEGHEDQSGCLTRHVWLPCWPYMQMAGVQVLVTAQIQNSTVRIMPKMQLLSQ